MKKILLILLLILPLFIVSGCKKEYNGKTIISIEYITKDYNGGYTNKRKIDFVNDKVYGLGFLPVSDKVPDYTELFSIDNSKEKDFINEIYNLGLLTLKKSYKRIIPVIDGGGWDLIITYEDGSTKNHLVIMLGRIKHSQNVMKHFMNIIMNHFLVEYH